MVASFPQNKHAAFSIVELMAVVTILGVLAAILVPRVNSHISTGNREACFINRAEIEMQVQLWRRNQGSFPAANLSDIAADASYFPEGLPTCPVDGSAYTIDTATGYVTGHTH